MLKCKRFWLNAFFLSLSFLMQILKKSVLYKDSMEIRSLEMFMCI